MTVKDGRKAIAQRREASLTVTSTLARSGRLRRPGERWTRIRFWLWGWGLRRAREGSRFTLLFEHAALLLVREMQVLAAARIMDITDHRLWRIVTHYVGQAVARLDLSKVAAVGLDETAAKRGQTYVTMFIDLDRTDKPVVFVTPGRGKDTVVRFSAFLAEHGGSPGRIVEVVCDMSGAFIAAINENFVDAAITVDWFHVVQLFTKAVDEVRRAEARHNKLPKALRRAILKRAEGRLTEAQAEALAELEASDLLTAIAWRIKEKLRWVRRAQSAHAARWRITNFLRHAKELLDPDPIRKALAPSRSNPNGSCSAGTRHTATPASRDSMASSRQPGRVPAATATPSPSPP